MKLIVGLGNPGIQYKGTRHNAGFAIIDTLTHHLDTAWQDKSRFKTLIAEASLQDEKILLMKPTTFYNNSGEAVRLVADFYDLEPRDILIVHDDINLPFGTVCTRIGSTPGGNNGLKSINQYIGSDTARVRIGTWNELNNQIDTSDFVLAKFSKHEADIFEKDVLPITLNYIDTFLDGSFAPTKHSVMKREEPDS